MFNDAIAYSIATGQTLLAAKVDITEAVDATNLDKVLEAAKEYVGDTIAE